MNIKETILSATNYGLDIILRYYPQAAEAMSRKKHFKLREDEKTASASIKLFGDCYIVKDFGSGKAQSCFDIVMEKERLNSFSDALTFICKAFAIPGLENNQEAYEPKKEFREATIDEKRR